MFPFTCLLLIIPYFAQGTLDERPHILHHKDHDIELDYEVTDEHQLSEAKRDLTDFAQNRAKRRRYDIIEPPAECGIIRAKSNIFKGFRIVRGSVENPHSYFFHVGVYMRYTDNENDFQYGCGGTIISPFYVLSAAHCFAGKSKAHYVKVGDHDRDVQEHYERKHDVQQVFVHPDYNYRNHDNDIAVLRIKQEMAFSDDVSAICVGRNPPFSHTGKAAVIGWGFTSVNGPLSIELREIEVKLTDWNECKKRYTYHEGAFCANFVLKDTDPCDGDSGGALFTVEKNRYIMMGIVSWGKQGCAQADYPDIYTNVSHYIDWIESIPK